MSKISVIVPVYNTISTLEKCIESLIHQTLEDIEIIIVDDGSPDGAGELCDILAEKDKRIKVIHKKNGGLSSARNAGMDIAQGEYIGFVDSDDYVDLTMFEKLYQSAKNNNSDIAVCSHYTVSEQGITPHYFDGIKEIYEKREIQSEWIEPFIGSDIKKSSFSKEGFVCRQIFRFDVVKNIRFKSEKEFFAEDIVFDLDVYPRIERLSVVNEPLLYYVFNGDSLSNRYRHDVWRKLDNLLNYERKIIETLRNEDIKRRLYDTTLKFLIFSVHNLKKKDCNLTFSEKLNEIKKIAESENAQEALHNIDFKLYNIKIKGFMVLLRLRLYGLVYFLI